MTEYDAVVVGAGAAGVGVSVALSKLDVEFVVLERDEVGSSFRSWPDEMRFITPSFPSNSFGLPDLNAVTPTTSPAFALDTEHPTGNEYAEYLEGVVEYHELPVETGVEVEDVKPLDETTSEKHEGVAVDGGTEQGFLVETDDGTVHTEFVVWAGGQFGAPTAPFEGMENAVHGSEVGSWRSHAEESPTPDDGRDDFVIVGGYESGIDAAVGLVEEGCSVTVIDAGEPWRERSPDPSEVLSPFTVERLEEVIGSENLTLVGNRYVVDLRNPDDGGYAVHTEDVSEFVEEAGYANREESYRYDAPGVIEASNPPILATGFEANLGPVDEYFPREDGFVNLTETDESPVKDGLFLTGPDVAHGGVLFCFIYKFRTRFPVIAENIASRLGVSTEPLEVYREKNMYLEDVSCCEPDMCDC